MIKWPCIFCLYFYIYAIGIIADTPIMSMEEIQPGMTGYGLSVFRGSRIERFHVEVISILRGFMPGEDVILIRCSPSYGEFNIHRSGLISGMSGSPIYIQEKLIGALSYGWADAQEAMAGVTSIESMLRLAKRQSKNQYSHFHSLRPEDRFVSESGLQNISGLVPLKSPLVISGATFQTFHKLDKIFRPFGFFTVPGGNGKGKIALETSEKLLPGSAIGAQLISGDFDITAVGTVTWVNQDEILAFGHPFFNAGEISIPITTVHIATVLESKRLSFKLGFPVKRIGTLFQDRSTGIYGRIGKDCPMIPLSVSIKNINSEMSRTFQVQVIHHPFFTPRLCVLAIQNFLEAQEASFLENTTRFSTKIFLQGKKEPLEWTDTNADLIKIENKFLEPLLQLYKNPFEKPAIEKMEVMIEVTPRMMYARITSMDIHPPQLYAGNILTINIGLLPQYGKEEFLSVKMEIPKNIPPGRHQLMVLSGEKVTPDLATPIDFQNYLSTLQKLNEYKSNQLLIALLLPNFKVLCRGKELSELPHTVIGNLLSTNSNKDVQLVPDVYVVTRDTPYVLSGMMNLFITIQEPNKK